jgi:integrase
MASIRKRRLPSGEIRWLLDYRDGAGGRRAKQFRTRRDAEAYETQARHEVAAGIHTADSVSVTLSDAADLWISRVESNEREASTLKQYRSHAETHLKPRLGAEKLSRLTTPLIEAFAENLTRELSRTLARKVLVSLKSIIKDAQRRGLIAHNPALPVRIDAQARHEKAIAIPSKPELKLMLEKVPSRWRPLLVTAMLTGLRASELRGLTWDHVDFDARVIRIRQRADAYNSLGSPKSRAGRRDVPMSPMVINTLKAWRLECPRRKDRDGTPPPLFVFPTTRGGVLHAPDILRHCWYPLLKACDLTNQVPETDETGKPLFDEAGAPVIRHEPIYHFHHLRHAAASLLIEQGAMPKRIQEIMGHSSIKVTFDIYGHLFADSDADQALMAAAERQLL